MGVFSSSSRINVHLQELIQVIENGTACQIGFCVWSKIGHWTFMCHWGKILKLIVFGSSDQDQRLNGWKSGG